MNKIREHIYLAALLHDIGKFYQRADSGSVKASKELKEYNKSESTFCPQFKGVYSHKHVLWTAQFIDNNQSIFGHLVHDEEINNLSQKDNLINLAAGHHLSFDQLSDLGKIIKKADWLSSGMDRESNEAMVDAQDEADSNWDAFKKKRMVSLLESINKESGFIYEYHQPIESVKLEKSYFPKKDFTEAPDYANLWSNFMTEFKFIQANSYHAFSETLLSLLYKYTTCIPSSTIHLPDVSLFDHLKTTAALAVCLFDFEESKENRNEPFLLIGADFSGIQSYIYQIVSKHAGKNLKGRSFYLKLLSDAIVRYLLKVLNLYQSNVIYNSGGGFYILAPNTTFVQNQLKIAVDTIEKNIFVSHGTTLFMAIDSIPISEETLMRKGGDSLGEKWNELFEVRDQRKYRKFSTFIESDTINFFSPFFQGGETNRDDITGEEFGKNEKPEKVGDLFLKKLTAKQIELGKLLRETDFLVVSEGPIPYWNHDFSIDPANLGIYYYFKGKKDLEKYAELLKASADLVSVVTLNGKNGNTDFLQTMNGMNNIYSLEFYGGNDCPRKGDIPLTYEDMCENIGFERMGVLRMDVDNLGSIFREGIPEERATLSRFSALSRSFDYFFSGFLNTIWRETAPLTTFIIYSGGDDLFIIGKWEDAIKLAEQIREDFCKFTCHNSAFSISAGISIFPSKFPVMKSAEESAIEESRAKAHKCAGKEKNSVSFMDMPLNWDEEYPNVKMVKDRILELLYHGELPKSFISKIYSHWSSSGIKDHKIQNFKIFWMLTYDLSRLKERVSKSIESINLIDFCINDICGITPDVLFLGKKIKTYYHPLELWVFAARWAELEYRTNETNNLNY